MKPKRESDQDRIELLQGTLDMLVLQTLVWGPLHGYAISHSIRDVRATSFKLKPDRSTRRSIAWKSRVGVTSQWKQTESKQRAKYYRLTAAGKSSCSRSKPAGSKSSTPWRGS